MMGVLLKGWGWGRKEMPPTVLSGMFPDKFEVQLNQCFYEAELLTRQTESDWQQGYKCADALLKTVLQRKVIGKIQK